jgi:hypothetical protein
MKSIVKNPAARTALEGWYQTFRAKIPTRTTERRVTTRYGETNVLVGGPENGPAIVVLHGALASSAHVLSELAPLLSTFRVYAVDIIGGLRAPAFLRARGGWNAHGGRVGAPRAPGLAGLAGGSSLPGAPHEAAPGDAQRGPEARSRAAESRGVKVSTAGVW